MFRVLSWSPFGTGGLGAVGRCVSVIESLLMGDSSCSGTGRQGLGV